MTSRLNVSNTVYPLLALICTVCVVAVSVVNVENTLLSQHQNTVQQTEESNQWNSQIDALNNYGGVIYYGTASSLEMNDVKKFQYSKEYWDNHTNAEHQSGNYAYKVTVSKTLVTVEWKSWTYTNTYESSHYSTNYHHVANFKDNSLSIPIESIRSIAVSHVGKA